MNEELIIIASASAAFLGVVGVFTVLKKLIRELWKITKYISKIHDEVLGVDGSPSVRTLVETLDADLRSHMIEEDNTIYSLRMDMDKQSCKRNEQWSTLTTKVDELFAFVMQKNKLQ